MMKHLIALAALAFAVPASAQVTSWRDGDRMAGIVIGTPQGQGNVPIVTTVDATGNPVSPAPAAAQGSAASGQNGTLSYCAVVSGNQTYTVGTVQPLNCITTGRLKVGVSSAGNVDPAAMLATTLTSDLIGCKYYATRATWLDGYQAGVQCSNIGDLYVQPRAATGLTTGQVSVPANTATLIVAASPNGAANTTVEVTTAVSCAYGNSGVTLATGFPLAATAYASVTLPFSGAIYAICPSAATVAYARPN